MRDSQAISSWSHTIHAAYYDFGIAMGSVEESNEEKLLKHPTEVRDSPGVPRKLSKNRFNRTDTTNINLWMLKCLIESLICTQSIF